MVSTSTIDTLYQSSDIYGIPNAAKIVNWIVSRSPGLQHDSRDRTAISRTHTSVLKNIPKINPEIDPETVPEMDPKMNPEIDPKIDPETDPEIDPEIIWHSNADKIVN